MPWPPQREDAGDWMRQVSRDRRDLYTDAHSGPGEVAHIPMYPADALSYETTTSTSYETLWEATGRVIFPRLQVDGRAWADGGNAGLLRLLVDGMPAGDEVAIDDAFVAPWVIGPVESPSGPATWSTITVEARRTSGAGAVHVGITGLINVH